jgi:hypothetical protein
MVRRCRPAAAMVAAAPVFGVGHLDVIPGLPDLGDRDRLDIEVLLAFYLFVEADYTK